MNPALGILAVTVLLGGSALAQTTQSSPADPLSVKPVPSQAQSQESASIRMRIERAGYTDVTELARDNMGIWRARARKGNDTVDVMVDKGGRIKEPPR